METYTHSIGKLKEEKNMIFTYVQNQIFLEQLKEFRDVELFYNIAFKETGRQD